MPIAPPCSEARTRDAAALAPAEYERGDRGERDRGEAKLDRHVQPALIRRVLQERRDAGEKDEHADLDRHVAFGEPAFDRGDQVVDAFGGGGRRRRGAARRMRGVRCGGAAAANR